MNSDKKLITIVGSLNYDITTYLKKIPSANETCISDNVEYNLGGKGFNQCVSASKSLDDPNEVEIRMLGSIGSDIYGKFFIDELKKRSVNSDSIKVIDKENTGVANIIVESGNNHSNRIMVFAGANKHTIFTEKELDKSFGNDAEEFVVLQNEIPDPLSIISYIQQNTKDKFIVYNPSPFNAIEYPANFNWGNVDVFIVNEIEAFQLASHLKIIDNEEEAPSDDSKSFIDYFTNLATKISTKIQSSSAINALIITLGPKGLIYQNRKTKQITYMTASQLINPPIDSTGCGDTFLGFFTSTFAKNFDIKNVDETILDALKVANSAAGIAVTRKGASSSVPTRKEVRDIYKI